MTGFPEQPTSTSAGDIESADVAGEQADRPDVPDLPGEAPERTVPDAKSAPGTSERMPPAEGIFDPTDDPSQPE